MALVTNFKFLNFYGPDWGYSFAGVGVDGGRGASNSRVTLQKYRSGSGSGVLFCF